MDNYIAMVSGQPPNPVTQMDCPVFLPMEVLPAEDHDQRIRSLAEKGFSPSNLREEAYRQIALRKIRDHILSERSAEPIVSAGCVYKDTVTIAEQLENQWGKLGWRAYMESMDQPCKHPKINHFDETYLPWMQGYTPRHNPFVYFSNLTDSGSCQKYDVPMGDLNDPNSGLAQALTWTSQDFPKFVMITPDLCDDGHTDCQPGQWHSAQDVRRPAEMDRIDQFVHDLIKRIEDSDPYKDGGLIVVTFDEAEVQKGVAANDEDDADPNPDPDWRDSCCSEEPAPGWKNPGLVPSRDGKVSGGGRIGAILISPSLKDHHPDDHEYNHYSMLKSIEDLFGLKHLGYADRPGLNTFQTCVAFNPVPAH
jgi:hypothetical protein